jgi:hypothetical protein
MWLHNGPYIVNFANPDRLSAADPAEAEIESLTLHLKNRRTPDPDES